MISPKKRKIAFLLCLFAGIFGAHRFYVGKHITAILQLATLGGAGVWAVVDLIFIVCGAFEDKQTNVLKEW